MGLSLNLPLSAFLLLHCAVAQARSDRGFRSGDAHMVVVTATPSQGLEEGIPRQSWYAKGIALDMTGHFEESHQAYTRALEEFRTQLKQRPRWARMIRGWILKAQYQLEQSQRLRYRSYIRTTHANFYQTAAKHNKWLAIRAFTGQDAHNLRDQIIDEYTNILRRSAYNDAPRIALAAFYHELGRHDLARQEFARVRDPNRPWLGKEVAYYYAAAGDVEQAFRLLEKVVRYRSSDRHHILRSNDFDRLRSDARFRKLAGEP